MDQDRINLIFDCDGTLVDSYGAITDKVYRLFLAHGVDCSLQRIRELSLYHNVGYCIDVLADENGLDKEALDREYDGIKEDIEHIVLYDHVRDVLENGRFCCFVYTHRGTSCREIFTRLGIAELFTEIVDATYGMKRKPDSEGVDYLVDRYSLDRGMTYYVGDRLVDIECGRNAGVGTIFFNSSGLDIDCSGADMVVSDLAEINVLFERKQSNGKEQGRTVQKP